VLHTWGQNFLHHPHVHFLVPGGGIALDGERWGACRPGFFLSVRFWGRLLHCREVAFSAGELNFFSAPATRMSPRLPALSDAVWNTGWVIYFKRPFAGPVQVLDSVGGYIYRVAIQIAFCR
jgi:hypothetical protein